MDGTAHAKPHATPGEFLEDVASVRQGLGQPVELGDHEGVPGMAGGQGKPKAEPVTVGASQPMVDVDAVVADAEGMQVVPLGGEVLVFGCYAGVSDQKCVHTQA